jgi:hypothetical protein
MARIVSSMLCAVGLIVAVYAENVVSIRLENRRISYWQKDFPICQQHIGGYILRNPMLKTEATNFVGSWKRIRAATDTLGNFSEMKHVTFSWKR